MKRTLRSFKFAFEGLWSALSNERNIYIQLFIGVLGLGMGLYFHINYLEWAISILTFAFVFSLELLNTAIEEIVDSFTGNVHPAAKRAKDVAAAAVFVALLAEILIGVIIFLPYISLFLTVFF